MADPEIVKVPPNNPEAEQALLGAMLQDAKQIPLALDVLEPESFFRDAHRVIFSAMRKLHAENRKVDYITLVESLRTSGDLDGVGGAGYLALLIESVSQPYNTEAYAKIIEDKCILRELIQAGRTIVEDAFSPVEGAAESLSKAEKLIFDISQKRSFSEILSIEQAVKSTLKAITKRYENRGKVSGVASGYYDLDDITSGFQKSDLIILAARPAMGKTSLAMNIVENVAIRNEKKRAVGVFSLEMSAEQLVTRMLCSVSQVDANSLRKGTLIDRDWENLLEGMGRLSESPISLVDHSGINTHEIRAKARKMKQERDIDLLVIDYLQLMQVPGHQRSRDPNRVQEVSQISRDLKILARELEIPIIALSQLSRAVEQRQSKRPQLSDLRESGSIEQDADIVMFIYRESYYKQLDKDGTDGEAPGPPAEAEETQLIVAKHRNGPTGSINLVFRPKYTRFESIDKGGGF